MFKTNSSKRKNLALGLAAAALCVALAGCSGRREANVGSPENPLIVMLSPSHIAPAEAVQALKDRLQQRTGMAVDIRVAVSPVSAIEAFGRKNADVGLLTTEEYLLARAEYKAEAGLQVLRNNATVYDSVLLVRADSPVKNISELAGKKVAFSDGYSASGFMMPAIYLDNAGIKVESKFAGSHSAAVKMLQDGQADAAATYGLPSRQGVKLLLTVGTLPNEPVVVRDGLDDEKAKAVLDALLELGSTEDGRKILSAFANITGFGPVHEDTYKPVQDLLRSARKSVYDLVPAGWDIQRLHHYSIQHG